MYVKEVLLSSEDLDIYYDPKYPDPNTDCKHDWDVFKYQCYVTFYTCIRHIYNCTNCNIFKMEVEEHQTREITNISFHEISPMEWMFKTTHDPVEYDEYFGHYECPECKSDEVADILFGLPDFTEELSNQLSAGHTGGRNPSCDTIACCWDADRLDIRRVGAKPNLQWFNTDAAREMVTNQDYSPIDN